MKRDGRTLDHQTLEAIRLMAIERVREGEPASVKKMMHGCKKPIHLVLDSLPVHKKASVCEHVASTHGRLTLHFLFGVMSNAPVPQGVPCKGERNCATRSGRNSQHFSKCPALSAHFSKPLLSPILATAE